MQGTFDLKILLQEGFQCCPSPCCRVPGPRARLPPYGCHPRLLAGRGIKGGNKPYSLFHGFVDFVRLAAPPACTASPAACASLVSPGFACAGVEEEEVLCGAQWHRGTVAGGRDSPGGSGSTRGAETLLALCPLGRDDGEPQPLGPGQGLSRQRGTVTVVSPGGAEWMCRPQQPVHRPQLVFSARLLGSAIRRAHGRLCRLPGPACAAWGIHSLPAPGTPGRGPSPAASWFLSCCAHAQARPRDAPTRCMEHQSHRQSTDRPAGERHHHAACPNRQPGSLGLPAGIGCPLPALEAPRPAAARSSRRRLEAPGRSAPSPVSPGWAALCFGVNSTPSSRSEADGSCSGTRGRLCWGKGLLPFSPCCLPCLPQLPSPLPARTSPSQTQECVLKS